MGNLPRRYDTMIEVTINIVTTVVTVTPQLISDGAFSMAGIDHEVIANRGTTTHADIDTRLSELTNVDNTSDSDKPISTATQTALDSKMGDTFETIIQGVSLASSQEPSGTDAPLQIEFGAAQGTGGDPVSMDALGNITFNEAGVYYLRLAVHFGRTGGAGTSEIRLRTLINGTQLGETIGEKISNSDEVLYTSVTLIGTFPAASILTIEIIRDSLGNDSGGLFQLPTTLGDWGDAQSARVTVQRFT